MQDDTLYVDTHAGAFTEEAPLPVVSYGREGVPGLSALKQGSSCAHDRVHGANSYLKPEL